MRTADLLEELNTIENEVAEVRCELQQRRDKADDYKAYNHLEVLVDRLGTALDSVEAAIKVIDEA